MLVGVLKEAANISANLIGVSETSIAMKEKVLPWVLGRRIQIAEDAGLT
tara:strand:+ start:17287 stop:17433 length:147 start_codon:yes stop_codon:yes gene_type:complete